MQRFTYGLTVVTCSFFLACGGGDDDDGNTGGGGSGGGGGSAGASSTPTLSAIQSQIFVSSCALTTSCHSGTATLSGLNLEAPTHGKLVNRPSVVLPNRLHVVPNDPTASYLMEKITSNTPAAGTRMPQGVVLPAAQVEMIRAWIAAGALDN